MSVVAAAADVHSSAAVQCDPEGPRDARVPWWLALLLAVWVVVAAAARLGSPWIAHQAPAYARLVEGHLVMRDIGDSGYFELVRYLAGDGDLRLAYVTNDLYRAWLPIFVSSVFYAWSGQMYWSIMLVDLLSWWLAAVCCYPLARRLRVSHRGSVVCAVLCATAPAFTNTLWMSLFKPANTASLVWSSYGCLRVLDSDARRISWVKAGAVLSVVLLATNLVYSYVWVVAPTLIGLSFVEGPLARLQWRGGVWVVGLALFVGADALLHRAFAALGWPLFVQTNDAAVRLGLLARQLASDPAPALAALRTARDFLNPQYMFAVFHPLVAAVSILGCVMGTRRLQVTAAIATGLALAQGAMTHLPWVVINNYPFVYAAAGTAVASIAAWLTGRFGVWSGRLLTAAAVVALVSVTNLDVLGSYTYVRSAWSWLGFAF